MRLLRKWAALLMGSIMELPVEWSLLTILLAIAAGFVIAAFLK